MLSSHSTRRTRKRSGLFSVLLFFVFRSFLASLVLFFHSVHWKGAKHKGKAQEIRLGNRGWVIVFFSFCFISMERKEREVEARMKQKKRKTKNPVHTLGFSCRICSFVLFIQLQMKGKGMRELNKGTKGTKTTTGFRV